MAERIRQNIEDSNVQVPVILHSVASTVRDGVPVVDIIYEHPVYSSRNPTGLRLRVDQPPVDGAIAIGAGETALERLADHAAYMVAGEPSGRSQSSYVQDEAGIWWHRYGFPEPSFETG